jgi:outer membrane protein
MTSIRASVVVTLLTVASLFCEPTGAAETEDFDLWEMIAEALDFTPGLEDETDADRPRDLFVRLGIIGGVAPQYSGSSYYDPGYAPDITVEWKEQVIWRGRKLGFYARRGDNIRAGGFIRYTGGRSDSNRGLRDLGDVSRTATAGAFFQYRYGGLRFKSEFRQDILSEGHGTVVLVKLGSKIPWRGKPLFSAEVGTSWASADYTETFYSITAAQALRSGLREYNAGSGIRDVSLSLSSGYQFGNHWTLAGQIKYIRLLGDAADSSIVADIGSADGLVAGLGLSYTF